MGSPRKIPTRDQANELMNDTNHTWTTINGKNGRKFTSKTYSTKYIFIPAAGGWSDTTYSSTGTNAIYWLNKYNNSYTAYQDTSDSRSIGHNAYGNRYMSISIRAIQ